MHPRIRRSRVEESPLALRRAATTAEAAKAGFFQLRLVARGHCEYGPMTSGVVVADIVISIAFVDAGYLTPVSFSAMSAKGAKRFIRFRSTNRIS